MKRNEPRNLRGLVPTKDMADFLGVPESTIRVWRKRHQDWVSRGAPPTEAVHTLFPDPVSDPQDPGVPFLINAGPVYDVAGVVLFAEHVRNYQGKKGNPSWVRQGQPE